MEKNLFLFLFLCLVFIGCASKTVIVDKNGNQETQIKTNNAAYSEAQAKAWLEYYKALSSPPVIATLKDSCGGTIDIKSQLQPPLPYIGQYKNQYIKPITDVVKLGIKVIGGGIIAKEVIGALDGVTINNNGSGNVAVDSKDISQTGDIKEDLTCDSGDKEVNVNVNNDDNSFTDSSVNNSNHEVTTNDVDASIDNSDHSNTSYIDHSDNSINITDSNDGELIQGDL